MSETYLKQPGFAYSVYWLVTKNKKRIKKFKETGDSKHLYQNELDKPWFQHDMGNRNFKDLGTRPVAVKVLHDNTFNVAKNPKYGDYQRHQRIQWFINFLIKRLQEVILKVKLCRTNKIYSKYAWAVLLKNKKFITITNAFQNILDESSQKPTKQNMGG